MADRVRLALVGCGWIAGAHIRGYKALFEHGCEEFEVVACCDLKRENAQKCAADIAAVQGREPAVFTDPAEMLKSGMADAADLCLPHCFHHSVAIPLLQGGMHVMVEKPVGITCKATRNIIEAAERAGRIVACAENVRRDLPARACVWALNEKRIIGEVRFVNIQAIQHGPFDYEKPPFKWRGLKLLTGGGMIMDSGAHFADMIQVILGDVDEVYCTLAAHDGRLIRDAPIVGDATADVEDTWHAVIRFKSGVHVSWTYSRSLYGEPVQIGKYYGSEGTMDALGFPFHPFQAGGKAVLADGTEITKDQIEAEYVSSLSAEQKERLFPYGVELGFAIEIHDFVRAIATGGRPEMDGLDGLRAKALCECCYESAAAGKPVKFDDVIAGRVNAYQKPIDEFWGI